MSTFTKQAQSIIDATNYLDNAMNDLQTQVRSAQDQCAEAEAELTTLKEGILQPHGVFNLESDNKWIEPPGNTGGSGGASNRPHGTKMITPGAGVNGSTRWSISPYQQKELYDNFYIYKNVNPSVQNSSHLFLQEAKIALNTTTDKIQAWEFNLEDRKLTSSQRVNGGLAALFGSNSAGVKNSYIWWDVSIGQWVFTGVPINANDWKLGVFTYVALELAYEPIGNWLTHVAFYINNTKYPLMQSRKTPANDWKDSNFLQYGFQLDTRLNSTTRMPIGYELDTLDMNIQWR